MKIDDIPPLDDDIQDILDAESGIHLPPANVQARIFSAVNARIAGGGASAPLVKAILPILGIFTFGALVPIAAFIALSPKTASAPVTRIVDVKSAPPPPPTSRSEIPPPPLSTSVPSPVPSPVPVPARVASIELRDTLAAERILLDSARSAFASGDADRALVAIEEHMRAFPRGVLTEEREALAVKALVMAGKYDEARARGELFRHRFPTSVSLRSVESSLTSIP